MDENPYEAPRNIPRPAGQQQHTWRRRSAFWFLVAVAIVYLTVVVPSVGARRLDPAWLVFPLFFGGLLLFAYFNPNARDERRYKALLVERESVDDEALFEAYFRAEEVASDIPGSVRAIVAKHMEYPAEKMLPDDDLMFYWDEVDAIDLILEIEERFGIKITEADTEHKMFTIRGISRLVQRKRAATSTASA